MYDNCGRLETFRKKNESLRVLYLQFFLNEIAVFSVYFRGLFYYWPTPIVLPPNGWPQARWRITAHERRSGVLGGVTTPSPPVTGRHRAVTGRHLRQTLMVPKGGIRVLEKTRGAGKIEGRR